MKNQKETGKELKFTIETDGEVKKIYVNDEKIEKVTGLEIQSRPGGIKIELEKFVTDENGVILLNEEKTEPLREKQILIDTF